MLIKSRISLFALLFCAAACSDPGAEDEVATGEGSFKNAFFAPIPGCAQGAAVSPSLATDGQRLYLPSGTAANSRVIFTGYRYNDAPPTQSRPAGEGKEQTFCGCQRVRSEEVLDPDGTPFTQSYVLVPNGAPSGDYGVQILPPDGPCEAVSTATSCPTTDCVSPTLSVAPSYIVSRTSNLVIAENSETTGDHPSEMTLLWNSRSGTPASQQDPSLISWSGAFPGGPAGRNHFTNADNSNLYAQLPLFVGPESLMTVQECNEECKAVAASEEATCRMRCSDYNMRGRFTDTLEFGFGGMEWDDSPSKAWGYVAGAAAAIGTCIASVELGIPQEGCGSAVGAGTAAGIGKVTADLVNNAIADDDDNLGSFEANTDVFADWNIGSTPPRQRLGGDKRDGGEIYVDYQNYRVPALRVLNYNVQAKTLKLIDGHERPCDGKNEVFFDARAHLFQRGQALAASQRFPNTGSWNMDPGNMQTFSPRLSIGHAEFNPENAPESPLIYVEFAVWEDDGNDRDLLGIHAETVLLGEFMNRGGTEGFTSEGYRTRTVRVPRTLTLNGYNSSEQDCSWWARGWNAQARRGKVQLTYDLEVTILVGQRP